MGFADLLDTMAVVLERECTLLPPNSHPGNNIWLIFYNLGCGTFKYAVDINKCIPYYSLDCALQLTYAAGQLKTYRDVRNSIPPLRTKFNDH